MERPLYHGLHVAQAGEDARTAYSVRRLSDEHTWNSARPLLCFPG